MKAKKKRKTRTHIDLSGFQKTLSNGAVIGLAKDKNSTTEDFFLCITKDAAGRKSAVNESVDDGKLHTRIRFSKEAMKAIFDLYTSSFMETFTWTCVVLDKSDGMNKEAKAEK